LGVSGALLVLTGPGLARAAPVELVANGSFGAGLEPWLSIDGIALTLADGQLCADVAGAAPDQAAGILALFGVPLVAGESYRLSYQATGSADAARIAVIVEGQAEPFTSVFSNLHPLASTAQSFEHFFTAPESAPAVLSIILGGAPEPWRFCLDDVSLLSGTRYAPDTGPRVRVNQLGYLPSGPKGATLVTGATAPVAWELVDDSGHSVWRGRSTPRGLDPSSGLSVHELRFDGFRGTGRGYVLRADGDASYPFDVSPNVYRRLRTDSLFVYYTQRSGVAIEATVAGAEYARAAGHVGVLPNLGDDEVPCQAPESSLLAYGEAWTCNYTLDVTGGWYDAGDHGKYVVNGGISTAELLSTYERTRYARSADRRALRDGSLRVPEHENHVPDILDEARWELEWMLKMQVPAGAPLAGMVHHKIHDDSWSGLPLDPAASAYRRELHRPSTAATLNLAAAAAQGARLYADFDPAFAQRLLAAARTAWHAALATPALYAPAADGQNGGGPYDDSDVSDEFYWAAAELLITTGEDAYRAAVLASPLHTADVFDLDGFQWGKVAALARLHLATLDTCLPDRDRIRRSVLDGADALITLAAAQPWGQPYAPADGIWVWGSTSQILNNLVVLGTAYDLSGRARYRDAALEGLDMILGRNALNISYVTGYGSVFSQNQHSRLYAAQLDPSSPHPPIGTIAGGPNSEIQDPLAAGMLAGCAPQFCYIDDIESWSTNELAINWNAALAWVASFAADQGGSD
jgi:endoglucanase